MGKTKKKWLRKVQVLGVREPLGLPISEPFFLLRRPAKALYLLSAEGASQLSLICIAIIHFSGISGLNMHSFNICDVSLLLLLYFAEPSEVIVIKI